MQANWRYWPITIIAAMTIAASHPMHVSHATIQSTDNREWILEKTMFTEDMEQALKSVLDQPGYMMMVDSTIDARNIESYLRKHLVFTKVSWRKAEAQEFTMTQCLVKPDEIKVALRFPTAKKFRLMDTSLMETDPHQENLYTVKHLGERMDVALWSHSTSFTYPKEDRQD